MAGKAKDVLLRFLVDDKQKSKLAGIGTEAGKTQSKFSQLSGVAKGVAVGFAGIIGTKIVGFLKDAATAAAEDQKAQDLLALAVRNSTDATEADIEKMEDWVKQTSLATGVADDELRPALGNLVRATGDVDEAQQLLNTSMDIAAARGLNLETVSVAMMKAHDGNIGALGRLGVATKDADGKTLSFEDAVAEAARTMGGAAAEAAGTMAGQMAIAKVKIDEAKESIGAALIPTIGDMAGVMGDAATVVGFLAEKMEALGIGEGKAGVEADGLYLTYAKWTPILGDTIKLIEGAADWIEQSAEAAKVAEGTVDDLATSHHNFKTSVDESTEALQDFEDEVRGQMDPVFNLSRKIDALAEAQQNTADAVIEYGQNSPQHLEALRKEAEAWLGVKDAQLKADGSVTREKYEENLRSMGVFTEAQIDIMLREFDRIENYKFSDKTFDFVINTSGGKISSGNAAGTVSGNKAAGGPVSAGATYLVGEKGPELLHMGANGSITPNSQLGGSVTLVNRGIIASPREFESWFVRAYDNAKRHGRL